MSLNSKSLSRRRRKLKKLVLLLSVLLLIPVPPVNAVSKIDLANAFSSVLLPGNLVEPSFVVQGQQVTYVTSFGNYSFRNNFFNYTHWNGTLVVKNSIFWVNASVVLLPGTTSITFQSNTQFQIQTQVRRLLTVVGTITVTFNFFFDKEPKITAQFTKGVSWTFSDYNIVWIIVTASIFDFLKTESTTTRLSSFTTLTRQSITIDEIEIGSSSSISEWNIISFTHWKDFTALIPIKPIVFLGRITIGGVTNTLGVLISFPSNISTIDPTTVATVTTGTATQFNSQHKTCYQTNYYWAFFNNAAYVFWASSPNGVTWDSGGTENIFISNTAQPREWNIWCDGTYVHFVEANNRVGSGLLYNRATTNSNGIITFGTWRTVKQVAGNYFFLSNDTDISGCCGSDMYQVYTGTQSKFQNDTRTVVGMINGTSTCWYAIRPFLTQTQSCEYPDGTLPSGPTQILGWVGIGRETFVIPAGTWNINWASRAAVSANGLGCNIIAPNLECFEFLIRVWSVDTQGGGNFNNLLLNVTIPSGTTLFPTTFTLFSFSSTTTVESGVRNDFVEIELFIKGKSNANYTTGQQAIFEFDTGRSYIRTPQETYSDPAITVDSSGFPAIAYRGTFTGSTVRLQVSCAVDGSCWQNPITIETAGTAASPVAITPLSNRDLYILYQINTTSFNSRYYSSSNGVVGSQETVTTQTLPLGGWSAIAHDNGKIRVAYRTTATPCSTTAPCIRYVTRNGGTWSSPVTLFTGTSTMQIASVISKGVTDGDAYVFWITAASGSLQYRRINALDDSLEPITTLDTVSLHQPNTLSVSYSVSSNLISLIWTQNIGGGNLNVVHKSFTAQPSPPAGFPGCPPDCPSPTPEEELPPTPTSLLEYIFRAMFVNPLVGLGSINSLSSFITYLSSNTTGLLLDFAILLVILITRFKVVVTTTTTETEKVEKKKKS